MNPLTMERRAFMKWVGVNAIAASLPVALTACVKSSADVSEKAETSKPQASKPIRSDGFIDVGSMGNLSESGSFRYQMANGNSILVVRQLEDTTKIQVFSSVCTHRGCNVGWQINDQDIFCACHGSRFSASGEVTTGPAESPLQTYAAKVEGDRILVKLT